jgi:protein subunit release factor B
MAVLLRLRPGTTALLAARAARLKSSGVRRDLVPRLLEHELEEKFAKGSGPGGQSVNTMTNAVFLKHLPTGIWVKCHQQKALQMNRKIARKLLVTKLDNFVNGEDSVEFQENRLAKEKLERKKDKIRLKYAAKAAAKGDTVEADPNVTLKDSVTNEEPVHAEKD